MAFYNEAFEEHGVSFLWPLELILRHHFGRRHDENPESFRDPVAITMSSPSKELAALKSNLNGLKVAETVLNHWTHFHIRVYAYGSKSTWTWYTHIRKNVRSSVDGIRFYVTNSRGGYVNEIKDMIKDTLCTPSHLLDMGITSNVTAAVDIENQRARSQTITSFLWELSGHRLFGKSPWACRRSIMEAFARQRY